MKTVFMIGSVVVVSMVVILSTLAGADVAGYYPPESDVYVRNSEGGDLGIAGDDVKDHIPTRDVVTNHFTKLGAINDRHLKCWSGYVGQGIRKLREKECNGSCATKPFGKGVIFDCAVAFTTKGCRRVQGSTTCFCNEPLCNDGTLPTSFLGLIGVNLNYVVVAEENYLQENYVNVHNSEGDYINDLGITGDDVTDHNPTRNGATKHFATHGDVNDRHLKCWAGFVGRFTRRLKDNGCSGSCVTKISGKGVFFYCAVTFTTKGCRRVQGSTTCFCNEPLCNDGTLPSSFQRFISVNLNHGAVVAEYYSPESDVYVHNSEEGDINELGIAGNDVASHNNTRDDAKNLFTIYHNVNDRNLKCWAGYVGQGMRKLSEKECNGSCATKIFGKGIHYDCAVVFTTRGCRRVQGVMTCFCNEPLCNDGTLPGSIINFVSV